MLYVVRSSPVQARLLRRDCREYWHNQSRARRITPWDQWQAIQLGRNQAHYRDGYRREVLRHRVEQPKARVPPPHSVQEYRSE
ncbi:hypothetical protein D3C76_1585820 [compost metagenome]